jgi:hypothetical protein
MMSTARDFPADHRRRKAHFNRAFLKSIGWRDMAHRHRRRALRRRLKHIAKQV